MPQPVPKVFRDDVVRIIQRDFPSVAEGDVLAILDRYGTSEWQKERDRVHLAILKLAGGKFVAVRQHTDVACSDYRDVLAAAEYPAYSQRGCSAPLTPEERDEIFERDWQQYQSWLLGK